MDSKHKRLLFINTREAYRNIFSELLCEAGYDVVASKSSAEALELLLMDSFDLVISDTGSLGLGGVELYLKTLDLKPELKTRFLFITGGHADDELTLEALSRLDKTFIVRPFGINELLKNISAVTGYNSNPTPGFSQRFANRRQEKRFQWEQDCGLTPAEVSVDVSNASTIDISRNGLRLRYHGAPLPFGTLVDIDIKQLKVSSRATVAWSEKDGEFEGVSGLSLNDPVDVSALLTVIQAGRWRSATY